MVGCVARYSGTSLLPEEFLIERRFLRTTPRSGVGYAPELNKLTAGNGSRPTVPGGWTNLIFVWLGNGNSCFDR
jgi:hypothetical protein